VRVLSVDRERKRIALSIKQASAPPSGPPPRRDDAGPAPRRDDRRPPPSRPEPPAPKSPFNAIRFKR
jgi:hypothetical protein